MGKVTRLPKLHRDFVPPANNEFARIALQFGPFKVTWPDGNYVHYLPCAYFPRIDAPNDEVRWLYNSDPEV